MPNMVTTRQIEGDNRGSVAEVSSSEEPPGVHIFLSERMLAEWESGKSDGTGLWLNIPRSAAVLLGKAIQATLKDQEEW